MNVVCLIFQHSVQDLLHAVVGVCSVSLPDMEIPVIYSTLTSPTCSTAVVLVSKESESSNALPTSLASQPP